MDKKQTTFDASYFAKFMTKGPDSRPTTSSPQNDISLLMPGLNAVMPVIEETSEFYDMSGEKYLYILNHEKYERTFRNWYIRPPSRNGTMVDVENLKTTFGDQGFQIKLLTDLKYHEIISIFTAIANQDHSHTSCLAIAIMTHGKNNNGLLAADRPYRLTELEYLLQNKSLAGKPKIMLVQACRDGHDDDGRLLKLSSGKTIVVPPGPDFLIMRATDSDHYAFINPDTGSFFFEAVSETLGKNTELSGSKFILTVNQKVAARATYNTEKPSMHNKKQIPEGKSYLKKKLVFRQLQKQTVAGTNGTPTTST